MMKHTLSTLGPKVLASRQVREYVTELYGPAARAGLAMDGKTWAGARDLAAYKARARASWPGVRVDHVEPSGVSDSPQVGDTLHVSAFVSLGDLAPDDVDVQLVHGRASESDTLGPRAGRVTSASRAPPWKTIKNDSPPTFEPSSNIVSVRVCGSSHVPSCIE